MNTVKHKQTGHHKIDRWDVLLGIICSVSSFMLYLRTITPGLLRGDSGEFQTLSYLLGNTHPTGYPIYLVMAKLMTFLPVGDIAYRVNIFSALMGAMTITGVYLAGRMLTNHRALSFIGALVLAVSPTFWSQAVIAEVYTTGSVLFILIIILLLWWFHNKNPRILFFAGLIGGLSLGVHMSVAMLAPAVLLFIFSRWRTGKKGFKYAFAGALTGVLITVAVFCVVDQANPTVNYFSTIIEPSRSAWGLAANEINGPLERLVFGWSGRQFQSFMFTDIPKVMPNQAANFWKNLPLEIGWPMIVLAGLGIIYLLIKQTPVGYLLFSGLIIQLGFVFNYAVWDLLYVFYIPSYILLTLSAIAGGGTVVDKISIGIQKISKKTNYRLPPIFLECVISVIVLIFSFYLVFSPQKESLIKGENPFDFDAYPAYDTLLPEIAHSTILDLPEHAIVFTDWDMVWPYYYAAHVLEERSDLRFIETYPADDIDEIADSVIDYVNERYQTVPIFFGEREPTLVKAGFSFLPIRIGPTRLYKLTQR